MNLGHLFAEKGSPWVLACVLCGCSAQSPASTQPCPKADAPSPEAAAPLTRDVVERFWRGVDKEGHAGCWIWRRSLNSDGYGQFGYGGKNHRAHRVAYLLTKGEIPDGLTLDHICRNKECVNPAHLEAVTNAENCRRHTRQQTTCRKGHPLDGDNLYMDPNGWRRCRECNRARNTAAGRRAGRLRGRARSPEATTPTPKGCVRDVNTKAVCALRDQDHLPCITCGWKGGSLSSGQPHDSEKK